MGNGGQHLEDGTHVGCMAGQETHVIVILAGLRNSQDNQNDQQLNRNRERDFLNGGKGRTLATSKVPKFTERTIAIFVDANTWASSQGNSKNANDAFTNPFEPVPVGATRSTRWQDFEAPHLRGCRGRDSDGDHGARRKVSDGDTPSDRNKYIKEKTNWTGQSHDGSWKAGIVPVIDLRKANGTWCETTALELDTGGLTLRTTVGNRPGLHL